VNALPVINLIYYQTGNYTNLFIYNSRLNLFDYLVLFPYWLGLILAIELFPYYLLFDITLLIIRKKSIPKLKSGLHIIKIALFVIFLLYIGFETYMDTYHIQNTTYHIKFKNLPEELADLTIILLGDVQVDRYTRETKTDRMKRKIKALNADLILFSGDLVTRGEYFIDEGLRLLSSLAPSSTRIACIGDHDYWADAARITNGLKKGGWFFLENSHQLVEHNNKRILITGITNIYSRKISSAELKQIFANAPAADLRILLSHQPSPNLVEIAANSGYDLFLSGHTHGGQVRFRPFGFTITPSMFETPYYSGRYQVNNMTLIVTNGIGLTLAPLRYQAPAEIAVIELEN
jgi:predicted MPP superfamily phosphohydrolase